MKILIVEDSHNLANTLQRYLKIKGYTSDVVHTCADALDFLWGQHGYDIVALDLNLPDGQGNDILQHMRSHQDTTPVIITTAREGYESSIELLNLGADCYITKPFHFDEFIARCKAIIRRLQRPENPLNILQFKNLIVDIDKNEITCQNTILTIPSKEFQILILLMERKIVCSKEQIINRLYQVDDSPCDNTIEAYISRLRKRLNPHNIYIKSIYGKGYILS